MIRHNKEAYDQSRYNRGPTENCYGMFGFLLNIIIIINYYI